ncbi:MAG TPA: diphosphate--fructose-6-phosphate 1-phosphotransferase [Terriglobia bacterium]|nr:diphosphate--fructose-6-phosphate 1-phosphotransferase [Terriglobia bacterium]
MAIVMGNAVVSHGGGPTAVLNSSLLGLIDGVRGSGVKRFWASIGGLAGMAQVRCVDMLKIPHSTLIRAAQQPGSYIRSFRGIITEEDIEQFIHFCSRREIRYCFYAGGNGSMGTALRIADVARKHRYDLIIVGVPKTVDNDICETDHCPGFGSAARFVVQAVRDIGLDQRSLPSPVSIIEVMGRNTGWLAAASMLARYRKDAPPHFVYVPEIIFDPQEFLGRVDRLLTAQGWAVGVVAEGLRDKSGRMIGASGGSARDAKGRVLAGNCSISLAALITRNLKVRARSEKPGLLCRALTACRSETDWMEAYEAGQAAARTALAEQSAVMVMLDRPRSGPYKCSYRLIPLSSVANRERKLDSQYLKRSLVDQSYVRYALPLVGEMPDAPVML